jgi:hypothetical protein
MGPVAMRLCAPILALVAGPSVAQGETGPRVTIELNAVETVDQGCRKSFVVRNGHDVAIDSAVYEAVLFDAEGRVERLTLFDFGALPAARPRVRQFVIPGADCADLTRLLFNGAETCTGAGLPDRACTDGLRLDTRTDMEVLG